MKVGDLVLRTDVLVRLSLGAGIIVAKNTNRDGTLFYQVKWSRENCDMYWYDGPELEVINESR